MVFKATSFGFFLFLMSLFGLLFRVNQATTVLHEESQPHRVNTKHTVSERGSINPAFNFNLLPVAGTDWLGWGVDIKLGLPENSLKIPLFTLEYNMQQTYRYPLFPTQYFIVPDYVYTRTIAQTDSSVQYFETIQEYTSYLALGLGLELQTAVSNSQNGLSNVTGPSPGTFSGSLDVNYYSRRLSETNTLVITNTLDTALWQLVLGPTSTVTPLVLEAGLTAYATSSANGDLTALGNFINRYGTHFIESVIVGGRLQMTSVTQKANSTTQDEVALLANIHFKNAFGLQEGAAEFNLTYSTTYQTFTQQSSHSLEVKTIFFIPLNFFFIF